MHTILTLFGTRPEIIKLAPVLWALERRHGRIRTINVASSQHTDLLHPFIREMHVRVDHDLHVMRPGQTPDGVLAQVLQKLHPLLAHHRADLVIVQGDTTTALGGALAAFHAKVPVVHVEAGLRTGNRASPFPEEMNRRLISQLAELHFAATVGNAEALREEGIPHDHIVCAGNPVVDALDFILEHATPSESTRQLIARHAGKRIITLTTHRRENFGEVMATHLGALRRFVSRHPDVVLVFPVHPNPAIREVVANVFAGSERIECIAPLSYVDFMHLLSHSWLIASDSGGIQEEAPALRKRLLILRDTTERPEVIACGVGKLVGHSGEQFEALLEASVNDELWTERVRVVQNPFGDGKSGERIADELEHFLAMRSPTLATVCQ